MVDKFIEIFTGLQIAYGQYIPTNEYDQRGKQKGKPFTARKPVVKELWEKHLAGAEPALGIIPINEKNLCRWGCIDIDKYNFNHKEFVDKIRKHKLPLVVCRSKSGGAHVFLFTTEWIDAALMRNKLKKMSALLGVAGSEIFPKQDYILIERGDLGSFLNLPYHGGNKSLRYAFKDDGEAASLEEFYKLYDEYSNDIKFNNIEVNKMSETEDINKIVEILRKVPAKNLRIIELANNIPIKDGLFDPVILEKLQPEINLAIAEAKAYGSTTIMAVDALVRLSIRPED